LAKQTNADSDSSDFDRFFRTDHLSSDLKGRTVRSGAITIASQVGKFALQTASTILVARLLTPEDYGLLGMVTIFTGFANLFSDLGLSAAVIQKEEINHRQVSNLFWINILIAFIVASIVAMLSPALVWFYKEPRLFWITIALSLNFIFGGLAVQHTALLQRQMHFAVLGKIQILSMFISVVTAVILAYLNFGYWSLVLMQWANLGTNAISVWVVCGWRPSSPSRGSGIKSMLVFGRDLTSFRIVNYFTRNLDNLVLGRFWGPQELGLYAKAYQLLLLPIQQINGPMTSVAIPALSSLQANPEKYRQFYAKAILSIATLSMPIMAFLFASADNLILLMLGPEWAGATILFRLLMPAAFVGTFYVATGWVYQSLGRPDRQLRIGLVNSTITSILFLISVRWGAVGVATAFGISQPILYIPAVIYCYKGTPLRVIDLIKTLYRPALAAIGASIVLVGIQTFLISIFNLSLISRFALDCVLYTFLYLGIWLLLPNGKSTLLGIFKTFMDLKKKTMVV
jgi:O-antigen/teichoic acid export membrane protein